MDQELESCLVDFLNLVFGNGAETKEFWTDVLIPETAEYFDYPREEIERKEIRLLMHICTNFERYE